MWRIRKLNDSEIRNIVFIVLKFVLYSGIVSLLPRVAARWRICTVWKGGSQSYCIGPPWSDTVGVYSKQLHVEQLGDTHGNTYCDTKACYMEKMFVEIVSAWIVNRACFTQLRVVRSADYFITLLHATFSSVNFAFVILNIRTNMRNIDFATTLRVVSVLNVSHAVVMITGRTSMLIVNCACPMQLRYVRSDDYLISLWYVSLLYHNCACVKPHTYINAGNSYCFITLRFASRVTVILTVVVVTILMFNSNDDHLNAQYVSLRVGITLELAYVRDHGTILERYMKFDVVVLQCRSLPSLRILNNETRPSERLESKSMKHEARCSKNLTRSVCSHDGIVPHFQIDKLIGWQRVRGGNVEDR
jgi:hypothetical protein